MARVVTMLVVALLVACGDKVPESKAAKDLGNVPRQTIDRVSTGIDSSIQQGADRAREWRATC